MVGQDGAIERFRRFATDKNVHVTLVVHPRKEDEGIRLGLASIGGTAKISQESDLVVILQVGSSSRLTTFFTCPSSSLSFFYCGGRSSFCWQNDGEYKYLDVRKNRYDGELGVIPLSFSQHTSAFYEDSDLMPAIKSRMTLASAGGFRR